MIMLLRIYLVKNLTLVQTNFSTLCCIASYVERDLFVRVTMRPR